MIPAMDGRRRGAARSRPARKSHDGAQRILYNAHMIIHIAFLPVVAALMLSSCACPQPAWLGAPLADADAEARMLPVASGFTQGELIDMFLGPHGFGVAANLFIGGGVGYLWTKEETGGNRKGGEIHIVGGSTKDPPILVRLNAIFLDSKGGGGNFAGVGLALGTFWPNHVSPYALIEGMIGYADADSEFVTALLPEIGVNFWIQVADLTFLKLGVGARYFLSTQGRDDDFLLFGVRLSLGEG